MVDTVILLHGAGRSPRSMGRMATALARQGYRVHNLGYASRRFPIEILAQQIGKQISQLHLEAGAKIHFVTHSLGGVVLRCFLKAERPPNLGRVVMLAPPNQGAALADVFERFRFYHWVLGPVAGQIGTGIGSLPKTLGSVNYEVGVIAGNRSLIPLFSPLIPGPDDGRVAVAETRLDGMADFLVLPCIHTLIMNYSSVIYQTIHFLAYGSFDHPHDA